MDENVKRLAGLVPQREFFIGFDSDGCVFDTMEIKQKECFCPNTIKCWDLQIVSRYARETWEFVNLYSKTRGINRFLALIRALDLLSKRKEVLARKARVADLSRLVAWTKEETKLGNPALSRKVNDTSDPVLARTLEWSLAINRDVSAMVKAIPPFPMCAESIEAASAGADIMVVSSTPFEALEKEWKEHGLERFVRVIAGQEAGSKAEHISYTSGGKYAREKVLMVGDAPGDLEAARSNRALFYPIIPGSEDSSWERFYREALPRFFSMAYSGAYEDELLREFDASLPERPPWEDAAGASYAS
jgi:phosphoglycolate phosphatase-like HAD superfamily hydrolase